MGFKQFLLLSKLRAALPNYAPFVFAYLCFQWPIVIDENTLKICVNI